MKQVHNHKMKKYYDSVWTVSYKLLKYNVALKWNRGDTSIPHFRAQVYSVNLAAGQNSA